MTHEITTNDIQVSLREDGAMTALKVFENEQWLDIPFREDDHSGPSWCGVELVPLLRGSADVLRESSTGTPACATCRDGQAGVSVLREEAGEMLCFEGRKGDVTYSLEYAAKGRRLAVTARLRNESETVFQPEAARIMLGLNTEMISYPEWNTKYFPTLMRAEKTHLWGYFMTPEGRILTLASPDPVASWNYEFLPKAHRILTVSLDPLHGLPLPPRHPQNMTELMPGQELSWTFYLEPVGSLDEVKPCIARNAAVPMIECSRYTVREQQPIELTIHSKNEVELSVTAPRGQIEKIDLERISPQTMSATFTPGDGVGAYAIHATDTTGKTSEALIYLRHEWSWYLKQARSEAVRTPQKASTHCESWMGHFSSYLAKRYFPDAELDAQAECNFRTILPLMFDVEKAEPCILRWRIQNVYYAISLLADVYQADGKIADLELAARLADWLIENHQNETGAYVSGHGIHYTCVAYGAKSMLELAVVERALNDDPVWRGRSERHIASAKAAVDDLARQLDDIGTEGQPTYEDGMIGCSATQLAMMALLTEDPEERRKYQTAAEYMFSGHRCLDQMLVPDARMREGTLRFWEAQYDVMLPDPNEEGGNNIGNMMNSPHGWTAWRIPGFWYMYQLTGEETWLRRAMESLGACVQLIDGATGRLRWAFVQDPYVDADVLVQDPDDPTNPAGKRVPRIIGEDYVEMISHFYHPPMDEVTGGHWGVGGSCDNDVHEVFKALEEVALTAAYVVERADGRIVGYNCRVEQNGDTLVITPAEEIVSRLHLNLRTRRNVSCQLGGVERVKADCEGMQWISSLPKE